MIYPFWFASGVEIEGAVLRLALRRSLGQIALYALLINGITHPLAWWAVQSGRMEWLTVELLVVVVETGLLALAFELPLRRAFVWSLVMNAVSAGAGLLV